MSRRDVQEWMQRSKIEPSLNREGKTRWQICYLYDLWKLNWASGPPDVLFKGRTQGSGLIGSATQSDRFGRWTDGGWSDLIWSSQWHRIRWMSSGCSRSSRHWVKRIESHTSWCWIQLKLKARQIRSDWRSFGNGCCRFSDQRWLAIDRIRAELTWIN